MTDILGNSSLHSGEVELAMKKLKNKMFGYVSQLAENEGEMREMEEKCTRSSSPAINASEGILSEKLVLQIQILSDIFAYLSKKLDSTLSGKERGAKNISQDGDTIVQEYRKLEKVLQEQEAINRNLLKEQLQNKVMVDTLRERLEEMEREKKRQHRNMFDQLQTKLNDVEAEKQEAINSTKLLLAQKNKEILSLHNDIGELKRENKELREVNEANSFRMKDYEAKSKQLSSCKMKCKDLQRIIDENESSSSGGNSSFVAPGTKGYPPPHASSSSSAGRLQSRIQNSSNNNSYITTSNKYSSSSSSNVRVSPHQLRKGESAKYSSDTDLRSSRPKQQPQLNGSSNSTLSTNTHKLSTPNKHPSNAILSASSRAASSSTGVNPNTSTAVLNQLYASLYTSQQSNCQQQHLMLTDAQDAIACLVNSGSSSGNNNNPTSAGSANKAKDKSIKQHLIKQIKEVNKEALNRSGSKEGRLSGSANCNASQHQSQLRMLDMKEYASYLSSGLLQSHANSNNNSIAVNPTTNNSSIQSTYMQQKRAKSLHQSNRKSVVVVASNHSSSSSRPSSSQQHARPRSAKSSSHSNHNNSSLLNIKHKEQSHIDNHSSSNISIHRPACLIAVLSSIDSAGKNAMRASISAAQQNVDGSGYFISAGNPIINVSNSLNNSLLNNSSNSQVNNNNSINQNNFTAASSIISGRGPLSLTQQQMIYSTAAAAAASSTQSSYPPPPTQHNNSSTHRGMGTTVANNSGQTQRHNNLSAKRNSSRK